MTKETVSQNIESINNKIANTSSVKDLAANDSLTNEILADESTIEINEQVISTPDFQTFQCVFLKLIRLIEENRKGIIEALHAFLNELTESMPWSEAQQEQIFALMATGNTTPGLTSVLHSVTLRFAPFSKSPTTRTIPISVIASVAAPVPVVSRSTNARIGANRRMVR